MGISVQVYCVVPSVAGPLPSPDNVTFSSQNLSTIQLQWKPPYNTMNNASDVIHVDPHITQYTVYTVDAYTNKTLRRITRIETSIILFSYSIQDDGLCLMYQVSAWNAGGEGELSEPVQESTPQGK